ncbi:MAG: L-threonylcarbamoyladenylate synthase [Acidobacteriota bacterium]
MLIFDSINDSKLVEQLKSGAVGVIPTDTVYGLVCLAADQDAVTRLYAIKSRENKPGTIIAAGIDQLVELGIPRRYLVAVEQYWPNPISVVIPDNPELKYLDLGKMSLALRVPSEPGLKKLLENCSPLLTTSANPPGEPAANNIVEAIEYFGEQVDFYVDGGDLSGQLPSTIIRVIDDAVEVIRQGAVKINEKGEIE